MLFYRGFDKKIGFNSNASLIWLSDDEDYAKEYGNAFATVEIDEDLLRFADLSILDEVCNNFDYDYLDAIYNPSEEMAEYLKSCGFNAFSIEPDNYKCCCILDKTLIRNRWK